MASSDGMLRGEPSGGILPTTPPPSPRRDLSPERKAIFYVGMALAGIGLISFLSTFVSFAMNFGDFTDFEARGRSMAMRAFGGMILIIIGVIISNIGRMGAAGAGLIPDPQRQRADLEPWNRSAGGMLNDALSEVDVLKHRPAPTAAIVKVRCPQCKALNDEHDKFCGQCGGQIV